MRTIIKKFLIVFPVVLLVCLETVCAQEPDALVYYVKGKPVKTSNGKVIALKKADKLVAADKLTIPAGATLVVICKSYSAIKLTAKETVSVKEIIRRSQEKPSSFTASYFHFIWEGLTHAHGSPEKDPREYLSATGAVSRGSDVTSAIADTIHYYNGPLVLKITASKNPFRVKCYNRPVNGKLLWDGEVKDDRVRIDSIAKLAQAGGAVYWTLSENGKPAPRNYLRLWKKAEYTSAISALLKNMIDLGPAETAYMSGFILEKNHFLAEAANYYHQAYILEPANTRYKNSNDRLYE